MYSTQAVSPASSMGAPQGNYFDAKHAALTRVPYYDYLVGPGYDQIPVTEYYGGMGAAFDDLRDMDMMRHDMPKNLPQFREALFEGHGDDGLAQGYHKHSDALISLDMAPDFLHVRVSQVGSVGEALAGLAHLPLGCQLNSGVVAGESYARQRDTGNPVGILFGPPFLGTPSKGHLSYVPHPN